jgi:hypothetical protein
VTRVAVCNSPSSLVYPLFFFFLLLLRFLHAGGLAEIVKAWIEPERSSSSNNAFTMR